MKTNKATVIIPTYNKKERLQIVLNAFNYQSIPKNDFEVILINDGSAETTQDVIDCIDKNYDFKVIYQENKGRSAARNKGIALSSNPLLIFCDDDTIPSKDFILQHIASHKDTDKGVVHGKINNLPYLKFFKDPSKGVFYDKVKSENTDVTFLNRNLLANDDTVFEQVLAQSKLTLFERQIKNIFDKKINELYWLGFTGGNVSVPKCLIQDAGLFDESFGSTWGGEDLEAGYRLYLLGAKFQYSDRACNYHIAHHRCDFQADMTTSMRVFYNKHKHPVIFHLQKLLSGVIRDVDEFLDLTKQDAGG